MTTFENWLVEKVSSDLEHIEPQNRAAIVHPSHPDYTRPRVRFGSVDQRSQLAVGEYLLTRDRISLPESEYLVGRLPLIAVPREFGSQSTIYAVRRVRTESVNRS